MSEEVDDMLTLHRVTAMYNALLQRQGKLLKENTEYKKQIKLLKELEEKHITLINHLKKELEEVKEVNELEVSSDIDDAVLGWQSDKIKSLQKELEAKEAYVNRLSKYVLEADAENESLQDENKKLKKELEEATQEINDVYSCIAIGETETEDAWEKMKSLKRNNAKLREALEKIADNKHLELFGDGSGLELVGIAQSALKESEDDEIR